MANASESIETDALPRLDDEGAMDATEKTVRLFAARIFAIRADFRAGIGPRDPLPLIEVEAQALAAALAMSIRQRAVFAYLLPEETATWGPAALGMWLAAQMVNGAKELEDGEIAEPKFKRRLDAVIATVLDRLKY